MRPMTEASCRTRLASPGRRSMRATSTPCSVPGMGMSSTSSRAACQRPDGLVVDETSHRRSASAGSLPRKRDCLRRVPGCALGARGQVLDAQQVADQRRALVRVKRLEPQVGVAVGIVSRGSLFDPPAAVFRLGRKTQINSRGTRSVRGSRCSSSASEVGSAQCRSSQTTTRGCCAAARSSSVSTARKVTYWRPSASRPRSLASASSGGVGPSSGPGRDIRRHRPPGTGPAPGLPERRGRQRETASGRDVQPSAQHVQPEMVGGAAWHRRGSGLRSIGGSELD